MLNSKKGFTEEFHSGIMIKDDIVKVLSHEVEDCKKRNQGTLYTFWHYANRVIQFADSNKEFRMIKDLWKVQGFNFTKKIDYPHMAKAIGAARVTAHVWRNEAITEASGENFTCPMNALMGYMNASNETVTWEVVA